MRIGSADRGPMTIGQKLWQVSWSLVLFLIILTGIGCAMLYSAGDASWDPWGGGYNCRLSMDTMIGCHEHPPCSEADACEGCLMDGNENSVSGGTDCTYEVL